MAALEPLHFGSEWGLIVKVVYSAAGVGLSFLAATGVLMYWHRYLAKRARGWGSNAASTLDDDPSFEGDGARRWTSGA